MAYQHWTQLEAFWSKQYKLVMIYLLLRFLSLVI